MVGRYQVYPEYKDSGIEWLDDLPKHWDVKKLKFLAKIHPSNVDKKTKKGELPVFLCNYTDVYYNDTVNKSMHFMKASATEEQINKFTLRTADIIITKDSEDPNDIAIPTFVPENMEGVVCGYHLSMIRANIIAYGAYIKRIFESGYARAYFATRANGLTRYGLGTYALENIFYPKPPEKEAVAIANFLNYETAKIDTLIEKQQQLIKLLKEKRQAVISHAVTKGLNPDAPMKDSGVEWLGELPKHWGIKRFKTLFKIKKRIAGALGYDVLSITQKGMKIKDIESGEGQLAMNYSNYQLVHKGDFAMNQMDLLTGFVDVSKFEGVTSPDYRVFILENQKSSSDYYLYFLQMGYINKLFFPFGQGAAHIGRWRLPKEAFNQFLAPFPPEIEQKDIARYIKVKLKKMNKLEKIAMKAINLMKEKRTALISAAVTGKIDVRNWQPPKQAVQSDQTQTNKEKSL
ncbi:restriction endonuclease subunit S [Desulfobacula sp.]|uniref:restriction endonuclease subunit S n=1 Tax=Desulfobacula sp. TaxID=2593537 RepID=UPI0025C3371A|nr:restriction endonuclease subunit S [Desulfobacula sp.]MBC2704687.1 restriction endonuclease subunit S [Desulfobacula sp.]